MPHYNIAFYSDSYLPAVDGVVTSMLSFKKELERRGHKVYTFATCRRRDKKKYGGNDVFLYSGLKFRPYPQYSAAIFPYRSSLKLMRLDIDIIHAHTPFAMGFSGMIASKLGRYPLIGTFHTMVNSKYLGNYYSKNRILRKLYSKYLWKYIQFFYRRCDITVAPSETIARMLTRYKMGYVETVPTGSIDMQRFNARISGQRMKEKIGIKDREKVVLYLGRLSQEKRLDIMLKAAKTVLKRRKDVKFVVGGVGPSFDEYRNLAKRLGIMDSVKFLGFVNDAELPQLYAASDLLCLPSMFETQGIVSLEAMAMGKPVVGSDFLALKELIKNGKNGERFKPMDYLSCANKMEKVLNNCNSYRKHAIESARNYSTERVTDRLLEVYEAAVAKRAVY